MLQGKTIILGVCGGIAVYKAASLCSKLVQSGADVRVVMTASATKFVTPLTFQTLSRHQVVIDTFAEVDAAVVAHIDLADRADLVVIVPATANILAKMAHGLADDMLSTTLLAAQAPILVAPAMNGHMYEHPAVEHNIQLLRERGVLFIEPGVGQLACGYVGKGRLAEPDEIYMAIEHLIVPHLPLKGIKVLITAGATKERIDPVRFLSNDSSGKMGYCLASIAKKLGADVTLISGTTSLSPPTGIHIISVVSAEDMLEAVMKKLPEMDIVIKAAAVTDFRPEFVQQQKMKKTDKLTLSLIKNKDILQLIGEAKTNQFVVGFAAETEALEANAMAKLLRKNCDLIVANDVSLEGAGFGTDTNIVQIYDRNGLVEAIPLMSKTEIAKRLLLLIVDRITSKRSEA